MRVLILGGTGFLGAALARVLTRGGHTVGVFHRGRQCEVDNGLHIHGNRLQLEAWRNDFAGFAPEVVIDTIAGSGAAARRTLQLFAASVRRIVFISSLDVYRAFGIFHGTESAAGALDPVPLTESSPLRRHPGLYPASTLTRLHQLCGWLEEGYDKLGLEIAAAAWPRSSAITVVRLGSLYGPGDRQYHLFPYWRRMADNRAAILLPRGWAEWRSSRAFIANAAAAVALASTSSRAAGRVYNLADQFNYSEAEWVQQIGRAWGWNGRLIVTTPEATPDPLRVCARTAQCLTADTSRIRRELGYRDLASPPAAVAAALHWERAHPPAAETAFDYSAENALLRRLGLASTLAAKSDPRPACPSEGALSSGARAVPPVIQREP